MPASLLGRLFFPLILRVWKSVGKKDAKRLKRISLPAGIRVETLSYGSDPLQTLFVVSPQGWGSTPLPVLVDVHGGGWVYGSKEVNLPFAATMASLGFRVIDVSYRLVDRVLVKDQFQDVADAVDRFFRSQKGDPRTPVFLAGDSAGAYFALVLTAAQGNPSLARALPKTLSTPVAGLVLNHPAIDLAAMDESHFWYRYLFERMFGRGFRNDPLFQATRSLDAIAGNALLPPTLMITSKGDKLLGEINRRCAERMEERAKSFSLLESEDPKDGHIFNVSQIDRESSVRTNRAIASFLKRLIPSSQPDHPREIPL